jgi:hypothetical protein
MIRQTWQLVVGAWLCAGMASGCALFGFGRRDTPSAVVEHPAPQTTQVTQVGRLTDAPQEENRLLRDGFGPLGSPYHPTDPRFFPALNDRNQRPVLFLQKGVQIPEPVQPGQELQSQPTQPPQPPAPPGQHPGPAVPTADVKPVPVEEPVVLALARLLKEDSEGLKLLDSYDPATREWFQRILPFLAELTRKGVEKLEPKEVALMQDQLQGLLLWLRARAQLGIDKVCYCEPDLQRPGSHKPLNKEYQFRPGEMVLLYTELRNLGSVRQGEFYEARLSSFVTISEEAKPERALFRKKVDDPRRPLRSRTFANDYFNTYSFYVPACIPPGRYVLKLAIQDETTDPPRKVRATLPFVVAAEAPGGE